MTRFGWMVVLGIVAFGAVGVGVFMWFHGRNAVPAQTIEAQASSSPEINPSELSIYTSGEYGFSFFYPSAAKVNDAFSTAALSVPWRAHSAASGTPIVQVLAGDQEVRVGVSSDSKEVASCKTVSPAEQNKGAFAVGSTTWQQFSFQKLGTENEQQVTSYRTVYQKKCYAVELFKPLSGTTDASGYTIADTITSFTFAQ